MSAGVSLVFADFAPFQRIVPLMLPPANIGVAAARVRENAAENAKAFLPQRTQRKAREIH